MTDLELDNALKNILENGGRYRQNVFASFEDMYNHLLTEEERLPRGGHEFWWQWKLEWRVSALRKKGVIKPKEESGIGFWELA